ncbi:MAG: hypothetical protein SFZ03_06045 [Candidatus Melainabacteria bacterium]|nr:hypothetical protein [Candidatus Melainabacteria bacterium]
MFYPPLALTLDFTPQAAEQNSLQNKLASTLQHVLKDVLHKVCKGLWQPFYRQIRHLFLKHPPLAARLAHWLSASRLKKQLMHSRWWLHRALFQLVERCFQPNAIPRFYQLQGHRLVLRVMIYLPEDSQPAARYTRNTHYHTGHGYPILSASHNTNPAEPTLAHA